VKPFRNGSSGASSGQTPARWIRIEPARALIDTAPMLIQ